MSARLSAEPSEYAMGRSQFREIAFADWVARRFAGRFGVFGPAPVVNWVLRAAPSGRPGLHASIAPTPTVTVYCVLAWYVAVIVSTVSPTDQANDVVPVGAGEIRTAACVAARAIASEHVITTC